MIFPATGVFLAFYLLFGTSSFTQFIPLPIQDRYFEVIVPYIAISVAMGVNATHFSARNWALSGFVAFVTALIITAAPSVVLNAGDVNTSALGQNTSLAVRLAKSRSPSLDVFASSRSRLMIEPFMDYASHQQLKPIPSEGSLPPGLYVTHAWGEQGSNARRIHQELELLPPAAVVDIDQRVAATLLNYLGINSAKTRAEVKVKEKAGALQ